MQTDVTDFIGAVRPVSHHKHNKVIENNISDTSTSPTNMQTLNTMRHNNSHTSQTFADGKSTPEVSRDQMDDTISQPDNILEWVDGPLIQAMRQGAILLIDEINLASDNILERLNSVLEFEKSITL